MFRQVYPSINVGFIAQIPRFAISTRPSYHTTLQGACYHVCDTISMLWVKAVWVIQCYNVRWFHLQWGKAHMYEWQRWSRSVEITNYLYNIVSMVGRRLRRWLSNKSSLSPPYQSDIWCKPVLKLDTGQTFSEQRSAGGVWKHGMKKRVIQMVCGPPVDRHCTGSGGRSTDARGAQAANMDSWFCNLQPLEHQRSELRGASYHKRCNLYRFFKKNPPVLLPCSPRRALQGFSWGCMVIVLNGSF